MWAIFTNDILAGRREDSAYPELLFRKMEAIDFGVPPSRKLRSVEVVGCVVRLIFFIQNSRSLGELDSRHFACKRRACPQTEGLLANGTNRATVELFPTSARKRPRSLRKRYKKKGPPSFPLQGCGKRHTPEKLLAGRGDVPLNAGLT